jgi:phosphoribosylaminoimidazolecarboxamide formyltransferase/IMP cyclohydrolase
VYAGHVSTLLRRALVSVSDKSNLDTLAQLLVQHKLEVLSTGGTYRALDQLGVAVVKVGEYTGFPEILDGRVKTLHPKIHGGILAAPTAAHDEQLARHDIPPIDLVVVNLYPFQQVTANPECRFAEAVENIDIGGPTMVRAAAKNHARVAVVVDPADYGRVADALAEHKGALPDALRRELAMKAFAHTAAYDAAIAQWLSRHDPQTLTAQAPHEVPPTLWVGGTVQGQLRYGENPHQAAGFYPCGAAGDPVGLDRAIVHQGKALSYNNLLDADAALGLIRDLAPLGPAAAVFKHASPCGAAVGTAGQPLVDVYEKALASDPVSAFGGIVSLSQPVDEALARKLVETFLEVVIAPGYDDAAREVLATKKNLRVLEIPAMFETAGAVPPLRVRSVAGGVLVQREDEITVGAAEAKVASKQAPTAAQLRDLEVAWRVCKHVRSNAIVLVADGATVGIGGGQTSRVDASRHAAAHAGPRAKGAVLASDGFFPFRDGVDAAAEVGVVAVIQPGGSQRDPEVIAAADEHGVAMLMTGQRHFRH